MPRQVASRDKPELKSLESKEFFFIPFNEKLLERTNSKQRREL
jgi:hypothetical protein